MSIAELTKPHRDADEYLAGGIACKRGNECPVDASPDYQAGYGDQYALEQIIEKLTGGDKR